MSQEKEGQQSDKLPELNKIIDMEEPEILVYRQTSGHSLLIPLKFNNNIIKATVDTVMVTLADYSLFTKRQLSESQEVVKLKGLGK